MNFFPPKCVLPRFESEDEELDFELQTPVTDTAGEATILDEEEATEVAEAIDEAIDKSDMAEVEVEVLSEL